MTGIFTNSCPL